MAVRYKYPIVDEGDYYGRISFQAMIQPPADIQLINQGISFFASAKTPVKYFRCTETISSTLGFNSVNS